MWAAPGRVFFPALWGLRMLVIQESNMAPADLVRAAHLGVLSDAIGHSTVGVDGTFYHSRIIPLKAGAAVTLDTVLADLTPCDYEGADQQQLTWNPVVNDETGLPYSRAATVTFVPTAPGDITEQTITGYAVLGDDSVTLLGAKNLNDPVQVNPDTPLQLTITLSLLPPTTQS